MDKMKSAFVLADKAWDGSSILFKWQKTHSNYLAVAGQDSSVKIFDRHGQKVTELNLPGSCVGMNWDKDGAILAVIAKNSSCIFLWQASTNVITQISSEMRDQMSFILWSKMDPLLAVGTEKGNLLIYNPKTSQKRTVLGIHKNQITCGCWSAQNLLALGSKDSLTISNQEGATISQMRFYGEPADISFSAMKKDKRSAQGENTVSVSVSKRRLILFDIKDPDSQIEFSFQPCYGNILSYHWFGDGYILIAFSYGYSVVVGSRCGKAWKEVCQAQNHQYHLGCVAVSPALDKTASCGDNGVIKINNLSKEDISSTVQLDSVTKDVAQMNWTDDGQLLAASTHKGKLHVFLTTLPIVGGSYGTRLAWLTSRREVTFSNQVEGGSTVAIPVKVDPSLIVVGPRHVAVVKDNRAYFKILTDKTPGYQKLRNMEYSRTIEGMCINSDHAVVLSNGTLLVHAMDVKMDKKKKKLKSFHNGKHNGQILCHAVTDDILVYGTESGNVECVTTKDWKTVCSYSHPVGVKKVFPSLNGTCVAFIDNDNGGFLFSPSEETVTCLAIPRFPPNTTDLLWDNWKLDSGEFVACGDNQVNTYAFHKTTVYGPKVVLVGSTELPLSQKPRLLYNGKLTCQSANGKTNQVSLSTHCFLECSTKNSSNTAKDLSKNIVQAVQLNRFQEAVDLCKAGGSDGDWEGLGKLFVLYLEVDLAIQAYQSSGNMTMVSSLKDLKLQGADDINFFTGLLASLLNDHDRAEELYLSSNHPLVAIELRKKLSHWQRAIKIARQIAEDQVPLIVKEYAAHLESNGDYVNALVQYKRAVTHTNKDHDEECLAAVIRMTIRAGDVQEGLAQALKHPSRELKMECGAILESMKEYFSAAQLYENGQYYDNAVAVYIHCMNWMKVDELLPHVTSVKVLLQYAKAMEAEGKYRDAAEAYERVKDWGNALRVFHDQLNDLEAAVRIVKQTLDVNGAKKVARSFLVLKDYVSAFRCLSMCDCNQEAWQLAKEHGQIQVFADFIDSNGKPEDYRNLALHFQAENNHVLAGKFFHKSGQYRRALRHFLMCPVTDDNLPIELAIETVKQAQNSSLTNQLISYLKGERNGKPKDQKFLFWLYLALQQYSNAAEIAMAMTRAEQHAGHYRSAHDLLLSMQMEMKAQKAPIPAEMTTMLRILHSYLLIDVYEKRGDHLNAAHMLICVSKSIRDFPAHDVLILKRTVTMCQSVGLRKSAYRFAVLLMRPQYRDRIGVNSIKELDSIIQHVNSLEQEGETSPCPHCGFQLPNYQMWCPFCKKNAPHCIATGRHMLRNDWCVCPHCDHPALYSQLAQWLRTESTCPMCSNALSVQELKKIRDCSSCLKPNDADQYRPDMVEGSGLVILEKPGSLIDVKSKQKKTKRNRQKSSSSLCRHNEFCSAGVHGK